MLIYHGDYFKQNGQHLLESVRANMMFNTYWMLTLHTQTLIALDEAAVDAFVDASGIDAGSSIDEYYDASSDFYSNHIPISVSNEDNSVINTNLSTYTFASQSFGAAASDRIIAVVIASGLVGGPETVSTVTIGGVSATKAIGQTNGDSRAELWWASVPTGTTGDVVVTFSGTMPSCAVNLYRIIGAQTTLTDTLGVAADPITGDIQVSPGGGVIAAVHNFDATATISWTGVSEDSEQSEDTGHASAGHAVFLSSVAAHTVTASISGTLADPAMVAGSWQPPVNDMTLQSQAFTASVAPIEAHLVCFVEELEAITYDTDFKGWASRDGGTTWTQVPLTAKTAGLSGQKFVQGVVNVSTQPSGTSMKYRITTHNNKAVNIHGAGLSWR